METYQLYSWPRGSQRWREGLLAVAFHMTTGQTGPVIHSPHTGGTVKRVLAITALLFASVAALATPATASTLCLTGHVDVNGTVQDINQCV